MEGWEEGNSEGGEAVLKSTGQRKGKLTFNRSDVYYLRGWDEKRTSKKKKYRKEVEGRDGMGINDIKGTDLRY